MVAAKVGQLASVGEGSDGGGTLRVFDAAFFCFFRIRSSYFAFPDSSGFCSCFVALGVSIVVLLWPLSGAEVCGSDLPAPSTGRAFLPVPSSASTITLSPSPLASAASAASGSLFFRLFFFLRSSFPFDLPWELLLLLPSICFSHNSARFSLVISTPLGWP